LYPVFEEGIDVLNMLVNSNNMKEFTY